MTRSELVDRLRSQAEGQRRGDQAAVLIAIEACDGRFLRKLEPFIDSTGDWIDIDWPDAVAASGPWSSGERALVILAASLAWADPEITVNLADTLSSLDRANSVVVLQAVAVAMGLRVNTRPRTGGRS